MGGEEIHRRDTNNIKKNYTKENTQNSKGEKIHQPADSPAFFSRRIIHLAFIFALAIYQNVLPVCFSLRSVFDIRDMAIKHRTTANPR